LQAASDWYWGTGAAANDNDSAEKKEDKNAAQNPENDDEKAESKEESDFHVEIEPELESVQCRDPILMMFKLLDFEKGIGSLLNLQFGDDLTEKESEGLMELFTTIYKTGIPTKNHLAAFSKMMVGEVILSFFASVSPTNPDAFGCWDRWLQYRLNEDIHSKLNEVDPKSLNKFFSTNSNAMARDSNGQPIWCILSKHYDGYIDDDTQRKAVILLLMSFFWNLSSDRMDLEVLRQGIKALLNLDHWSLQLIGWSTVYAIKDAMVAFPYALHDIYILNAPMGSYISLIKTTAAMFFTAHSLDKFVILNDTDHFMKEYASKENVPADLGGDSKALFCDWMKDRGYI